MEKTQVEVMKPIDLDNVIAEFLDTFDFVLSELGYDRAYDFESWQWAVINLMYMYISAKCPGIVFDLSSLAGLDALSGASSNIDEIYNVVASNTMTEFCGWVGGSAYIEDIDDEEDYGVCDLLGMFEDPQLVKALREHFDGGYVGELVVFHNPTLFNLIKEKGVKDMFDALFARYYRHFGATHGLGDDCFKGGLLFTDSCMYYAAAYDDYPMTCDFSPLTYFIAYELYRHVKEVW